MPSMTTISAPSSMLVAFHRLPSGYERSLRMPLSEPAIPRPAATLALLRTDERGMEVLLLQRSHRTRFIPGAYVFPGGRVDPRDGAPDLFERLDGPRPEVADARLDVGGTFPPGLAFWVAALRETFEETGVLLTSESVGYRSAPSDERDGLGRLRGALHRGAADFRAVVDHVGSKLAGTKISYIGHWVTPVQERQRYDARFFAAELPRGCPVLPDGEEMLEAIWVTPSEALSLNREGVLPMVFPTLVTLETLKTFETPADALRALGGRKVPRLLPRVEESDGGVLFTPRITPPT
jgi:8-oxo-dGTP pyrophosphatase MutT (NUDIX family)